MQEQSLQYDAWFDAAKHCSLKGLEECYSMGFDVDVRDALGNTALFYCVCRNGGCLDAVKFLLEHGADVHFVDDQKRDLLEIGFAGVSSGLERMGMVGLEKLLIEYGV